MITVDNLSVHYPIYSGNRGVMSGLDGGRMGAQIVKRDNRAYAVALDHLNISFEAGEITALVGINGAGKSTLLRTLAGILPPTTGRVVAEGRIVTMFTRNLGLDRNASGEDNLKFFAALNGLSRSQTRYLIEDVAEFSELGPYMKLPLSTYSAGMSARLGFGAVTSLEADIMLIDELIGAGDHVFQAKAASRFQRLLKRSSTVVLATHRRDLIDEFCTNALWLERGKERQYGLSNTVMDAFQAHVRDVLQEREQEAAQISEDDN